MKISQYQHDEESLHLTISHLSKKEYIYLFLHLIYKKEYYMYAADFVVYEARMAHSPLIRLCIMKCIMRVLKAALCWHL